MDKITYEKSGVNIDTADATKCEMAKYVNSNNQRVLNKVGAFASLYDIKFPEMKNPILVLKTEEPGSKQKFAFKYGKIKNICYDMINHLTNDILVMGATPLTVQDAIICSKIEKDVVSDLVKYISQACKDNGSVLTGGETSEQPDVVEKGIYVLTSSIVGIVEKENIVDGSKIQKGDVVKFDAGVNAEFDFYTTDTSRAWVMEGADPALYKLKDRLYEAQRRMIAAAKPGLPINELYHIAYDYVKEMFPSYRRGHQGHSISMGPATAEAPYINPTTTRPLEAGMVLAMEVPCYIGGVQGFNIEDMVLITEDGCEVLTPNTPHYL